MKKIVVISVLFLLFSAVPKSTLKKIKIYGNSTKDIIPVSSLVEPYVYHSAIDLSELSVKDKKQAFINLMLPSILIAKYNIKQQRNTVLNLIEENSKLLPSEMTFLEDLFRKYKCESKEELLSRLQTHPTSIIIAQAAIESGWGTSRFYKEANNVFGIWSYNSTEPRIKASENREGKEVYVKRYSSLPESIESYFLTIARGPYNAFREEREKTNEVSALIPYLRVYSELKEEYVKRLGQLIQYNELEQYDAYELNVNE